MGLLWLLAAILLIAWLLGLGGVYAIGSLVHIFLVLAVIAVVISLIAGPRRTVV